MPEVPKSHPEKQATTVPYEQFLQRIIDTSFGEETQPGNVGSWYREVLSSFRPLKLQPETELAGHSIHVEKTGAEIASIDIHDGQKVVGYEMTRTNPNGKVFSWHQPGIQKKRHSLELPTKRGEKIHFSASDMVVIIRDPQTGEVLLTPKQEPFARTPHQMVLDSPLRLPLEELGNVFDGEKIDDERRTFVRKLWQGKSVDQLIHDDNISFFASPMNDPNRTTQKTLGIIMNITPDMKESLLENSQSRWCSEEDIKKLHPVLSGPAASALFAYQGAFIPQYRADYADEWYQDRLTKIGSLDAKKAPTVTDSKSWNVKRTGEKESGVVGGHFSLQRFLELATTPDGPETKRDVLGLLQTETPLRFPVESSEMNMNASGVLGLVKDTRGRVLLTVEPEPFVDDPEFEKPERPRIGSYEKRGLIRTMQFSTQKLVDLIEGKAVDEGLEDFFDKVSPAGKNVHDLFQTGAFAVSVLPPADPGTISATNLLVTMTVDDPRKQEQLVQDGTRRWFTLEEAKILAYRGKVNAHTATALLAA